MSREGVDTKETKPTDEPIAIVEPTVDYQETLKQEQETIEKNIDLINNAVSTGDIVLCEGISEEGKKQECSESVMAKSYALSGTIEDCATIQTESIRTSCQSSIKQSTAMTSLDKDLCSELATS